MKRLRWLWVFAVILALFWQGIAPPPSLAADPERLIVVFSGSALPGNAADVVRAAGGTVVETLPEIGVVVAEAIGTSGEALAARLRRQPGVLGVGPDIEMELIGMATTGPEEFSGPLGHTPVDFPFTGNPVDWFYTSTFQQWAVKRVGAQGGGVAGGSSPGAWDVTFGAGAKIAILDTGVSPYHLDIAPNLIFNASFTTATICDDGGPVDQAGHGTWTASLAAGAKGLGTGLVIGVAPQAQILNVKVLRRVPLSGPMPLGVADTPFNRCRFGGGSGRFSWVLSGIILAAQQGADVISMSLGGTVPRNALGAGPLLAAFNRVTNFATAAGAVVIASAGNSGLDLDRQRALVILPHEASNVISVMATTNPSVPPAAGCAGLDCLASYSNFGSSLHGLAAPGGDLPAGAALGPTGFVRGACSPGVAGTIPGHPPASRLLPVGSFGCFSFSGASQHAWYVLARGTSASAPLVAGAAALLKAANPGLSPSQIRTRLQQTAADIGNVGYDEFFNFGLVNACRAVGANCP